ncbi:DEAD/DEAH box helicase family protein [Paraburkholderia sp. UCT2]|uniref:DEAD/DEAH box helicase family protein n=1 Tax=Paraburkholderia sp. UCT2 TaxID=2615208 RepID=UPI0016564B5E|nr:DEAD/DEAH box helicase family protein [Paraburkholderia sp. UCT2]MBC8732433.1 hypothetical protein [Paraburkholderia sp. UCT2]
MDSTTKIYLVDGVCGSGKTQAMIRHISESHTANLKFVIAQPTKRLCEETATQLRSLGVPVTYVSNDDPKMAGKTYAVYQQEVRKLASRPSGGVVITTHHTFFANQHHVTETTRSKLHLFFDEIPQVDSTLHLNVKKHHDFIEQHFDVIEFDDNHLLEFSIRPGSNVEIESMLEAGLVGTDIFLKGKEVRDFLAVALDVGRKKYLNKARWNTRNFNEYQLHMHSLLMPDAFHGWNTCRIMGANAKSSMMYFLWQHYGVEFEDDKKFVLKKAHPELANRRIEIHYFSGCTWSKSRRDKASNRFDNLSVSVDELFQGERSLWVANNDVEDSEWKVKNSTRISNISHGINEYREINNIAFLSALNDAPAHFEFVARRFGVDDRSLKRAKALETMYQAVMRTSLRVPHSTETVRIVVGDKDQADFLSDLFPNAKVFTLNNVESAWGEAQKTRGRPKQQIKKSQDERKKESKQRENAYLLALERVTKNTIDEGIIVTHESSIYSRNNELTSATAARWDEVLALFTEAFDVKYGGKKDNSLLNFVSFKSDSRTKTKTDIEYVTGIQLDFDSGMLSWQQASAIFSDIKHFTYNSFNNGKENTLRFRIVIPFDRPVTVEIAEALWDVLADRVRSDGWFVGRSPNKAEQARNSGLDVSKRPANSFYYAPCQSVSGKKWSFFDTKYWHQPVWNVLHAIGNMTIDFPEYVEVETTTNRGEELKALIDAIKSRDNPACDEADTENNRRKRIIERAEARWQQCTAGEGHHEWFVLAYSYFRVGLDFIEVETRMRNQLQYAHSPAERRNELKGVVKSAQAKTSRCAS